MLAAMAEGPDPKDELEKDITCALCCGHYQVAEVLSCNHYYCKACIELLAKRSRGSFPCPECRRDATLPSGGVEELQSSFFMERMRDVYEVMAQLEGKAENTSDQDLMGIRTHLQSKMEEEEKRHQQLSPDPATATDLAYYSPSLKPVSRDMGEVLKIPAILQEMESMCQLGDTMQVTIAAPTTQLTDVHAQLQSLADPTVSVQGDVVGNGTGVYHITFTPCVRGRHDLTVKVNGQDIAGCPFRVFVKIHPNQLGPPVWIITEVNSPYCIAINSEQQLVVTEGGEKNITIRERDGKILQTIMCDKLQYPAGVATGQDGAIYVTDTRADCLFKFDKDRRLLKTVENEFQSLHFLKCINNQLYVSDYYSNDVKILDVDCNIIGTIPVSECSGPGDIAVGDDGLYVVCGGVEESNIGVYTCVPNGEFKHHLNLQPSSLTLSFLDGICFDCSGHLFVTQCVYGVGSVLVFKPSGEHVATLGHDSNGVKLWCPIGIAVDEDGFVYVCDSDQNIVVVF